MAIRYTRAAKTANEIRKLNRWKGPAKPVIDTSFDKPYRCWIVTQKRYEWAVVVYNDEPNCIVSTGNAKGRYIPQT